MRRSVSSGKTAGQIKSIHVRIKMLGHQIREGKEKQEGELGIRETWKVDSQLVRV